jgi:tRNA-specific 2-thiouridylase
LCASANDFFLFFMAMLRKAVALISGGLDSMLAVRVMQDQGIYVEGLNFFTGFCVEGHTHAIRKQDRGKRKRNNALWVCERLGVKLHFVDVVDEYRDVLLNPKYGYGANLNPCLDCKIFMVKRALTWMQEQGFDFIITGEVVGQRPKSQRKDTMPIVQRDSGAEDLLLRPLCAKHLPLTLPERKQWVDRERLFDFCGRSRKPQMALAKKYGLDDYAQPAGGCCFLTDPQYSQKLTDLWTSRGDRAYDLDDIMLLKVGRHLRPRPNFKVIIAREEGEGHFLRGYRNRFVAIRTLSHGGPEALIDGAPAEQDVALAARLVARYGQGRRCELVRIEVREPSGFTREIDVRPLSPQDVPREWML